jgi:diphthine-ammonia ligase
MYQETWMNNKGLVEEKEWVNHIKQLNPKTANLKNAIIQSIEKRIPKQKFGIMFSGGIDSTLIALLCKGHDFICYTAGLENSQDLEVAKKAAKDLGLTLKHKTLSLKQAEKIIKQTTKIVGPDTMKVGVGSVFQAVMQLAKKDGIKILFSGLGSEEIFAGYERHLNSDDINEECWSGLKQMWQRDLTRDYQIAKLNGMSILTPFLDDKLIQTAMAIPGQEKIIKNVKKYPLRIAALSLGLPEEYSFRPKKAAQYGSRFDKAIEKLTKQNKFKYKADYLKSLFNLGVLFSSGKDSTYSAYLMRDYNLACLITIKSENQDSYMFHTPAIDLTKLQAKSMNLPLVIGKTKGKKEIELKDLEKTIKKAKKKYDLHGIATGALYSNYQRERIEKICEKLGLMVFSPLWHIDQEEYVETLIKSEFKIMIASVAAQGLTDKHVGKIIDTSFLNHLKKLNQKVGLNVAGEGGEYESIVLDCPLFTKQIKLDYKIVKDHHSARLVVVKSVLA